MPDDDIRLLALDGGGVRGLSSLMILRSLMSAIDPDSPPKPCDFFDMIGGTSTGGLIAIMLGRLRMSVDDCIAAYISLSDEVFQKSSHRIKINGKLQGRFDGAALERAIKQILVHTGHDEDALLKDASSKCRVFVCATSKQTNDTVCLTSYRTLRYNDLLQTTKVWQACRATSAATTFFDPITIGGMLEEEFVDGALGRNNPVFELWNQAQDVWGDRLRDGLRCLVSIGTGVPALEPVRDDALGILSTLKAVATETERTAELFRKSKSLLYDGRYFRFNVVSGLQDVGLEDSNKRKEIGAATRRYIQSQAVLELMTAFARDPARRQHLSPYAIPLCLAGVPVSAKFVNRPSDIAHLERCLLGYQTRQEGRRVFVLYGLGGVGKTQLTVDFVRRYHTAFSAILWLDGRSEDRLKRSIAGCVDRIPEGQIPLESRHQAKGRSPEDLDAAVATMTAWLGRPDNRDWLLVFDNVDLEDGVDGAYDLMQYLPWDHGAALVTTRASRLTQLALPNYSRKLAKVDNGLDRAILEAWYGGNLGPDADQLLKVLDGLPLALAQAASYLRETGISIATYLKNYQHQWDELMASESDPPLRDYEQGSIATTWTISFRHIEAKSVTATRLLRLWAFLDNNHLWHGLLTTAAVGAKLEKWPEWLRELATSEVRFLEAIRLLRRYSMIEAQETKDSYSMHPVVHKWASRLDDRRRRTEYARLALMVVSWSIPTSNERGDWVFRQQLLPHAQHCAEWAGNIPVESLEYVDKDILEALHTIGSFFLNQGKPAEAEAVYMQVLDGREKARGPDHPLTLAVLNSLGILYSDQSKLSEAEAMYHRVLGRYEETLGLNHIFTLTALLNQGNLYKKQGKQAEAEAVFHRALAGCREALGPTHMLTLSHVFCLGSLYWGQGRLSEAETMYRRALAGYEEALGPNDLSTLMAAKHLGCIYQMQGRLAEAEAMYRRVLAGREKALGPDHPLTLEAANILGILYSDQGKPAESEAIRRRELAGREKAFGPDDLSTINTVRSLGLFYWQQGKWIESEAMYLRALASYEKALGPNHPSTLDAVHELGLSYWQQGKLVESEAMLLRRLAGCEEALGSSHAHTLTSINTLGVFYVGQGRFVEAEAMFLRALASLEKAFGNEDLRTKVARYNLEKLQRREGEKTSSSCGRAV